MSVRPRAGRHNGVNVVQAQGLDKQFEFKGLTMRQLVKEQKKLAEQYPGASIHAVWLWVDGRYHNVPEEAAS
jgi:hypothetical protein